MGGKNEILLSIALEGDDEVKSKLDGVAESGKKLGHSFGEVGKGASEAGEKLLGKLGEPLGELKEAFEPFLKEGGLAGVFGGGLISRLFGAAGPAAAVAALSGVALHLAKVSEESDKTGSRLKAFGAGDNPLEKLNEHAKTLGTPAGNLEPGLEKLYADHQKDVAKQELSGGISHSPNFKPGENEEKAQNVTIIGGRGVAQVSSIDTLVKAREALINEGSRDQTDTKKVVQAVDQFRESVRNDGKVTSQSLGQLRGVLPHAADFVARSTSQFLGRPFNNSAEQEAYIDKTGAVVPPNQLNADLAKHAPEAQADADKAHGVSGAFDNLARSAEHLDEVFGKLAGGPINKAVTEGLDKVAGGIDKAAELVEHNKDWIDKGAELGGKVGDALPIPFGKQIGSFTGGIEGGALGVGVDIAKEGFGSLASSLPSWLKNAAINPGAVGPNEAGDAAKLTPEALSNTTIPRPFSDSASRKALLIGSPLLGAAAILPELFGLTKGEPPQDGPAAAALEPEWQDFKAKADKQAVLQPPVPQKPQQQQPQQPPQQPLTPASLPPPQQGDTNPAYNWPIAPARPTEQPPQQQSAVPEPAAVQQGPLPSQPPALVEAIAGAITNLLSSLRERALGPENNRIDGPVDGLGLRGDASPQGEEPTQNVAALDSAAGGAAEGLRKVASAAPAAADKLSNSGDKSAPTENVTAKDGGFIHRFDGGGAVRGPGTSTSDDIPARLSDGEYVVNARETSRNRGALHAINNGTFAKAAERMFARGGIAKFADGGTVAPMGTSSVAASYDPDSGGVIIDGVKHSASDPDPVVQAVLKNAKAEYDQQQAEWQSEQKKIKATRHKSDFVGFFGSSSAYEDQQHQAGSQLDPFADGGIVQRHAIGGPISGPGTTTSDDIPAYLSHGEFVVNARETGRNLSALHAINGGRFSEHLSKMFASGGLVDVPHFADGGHAGGLSGITPGPAPSTGDIGSSSSDMSGYHHVDMRTDFGNFRAMAPEHVARSMSAAARDSANAQTGQRPSWYRGR